MRIALFVLALIGIAVATALLIRDLLPPDRIVMAAGAEGGGYWRVAERYRDVLAADGIEVEVLATAGSVDNAQRLAEGAADVALLQGGVKAAAGIEALAAVFPEPLLVFAGPGVAAPANPARWSGLRVAGGASGSGTRAAARELMRAAGGDVQLIPLGGADAVAALQSGEIDIALFVSSIDAPNLAPLLAAPDVSLIELAFLPALAKRMPQSAVMTLPAGTISLMPPTPTEDLRLLALTARLVAVDTLHPAIVNRLVLTAVRLHRDRSALAEDGAYPTLDGVAMPLDAYASDLLADGPGATESVLPYWIAAQIDRVLLLILPILFLLLPLLRIAPGLYAWQMRARVFRHYEALREIDRQARGTDPDLGRLSDRLDAVEREIADVKLPPAYRDQLYDALMHVDLIRRRIDERRARPLQSGADAYSAAP